MGKTFYKEVEIELTDEDILEAIDEMSSDDDDIVGLIKELDEKRGSWTFTKGIAREFMKELLCNGDEEDIAEVLGALNLVRTGDDEEEEEDEDEETKSSDAPESHFHVYRDGKCYCGEPSP